MRIFTFGDLHIGSINDIPYVYNVTTDIVDSEITFKKTDLLVILGDFFDRLFKVNEEYVSLAINIMSYIIRACAKTETKIRVIYGTESHEMNQYHIFNHHINSSEVDFKIFNTVTEEETFPGVHILYIPEEYVDDKHEFYNKYLNSPDKKYNYIFGHGIIEDGLPPRIGNDTAARSNERKVPRFKSGEFASVAHITVFGHYHSYCNMGNNVYYLGSLFRDSFGEDQESVDKGYGIIEDNKFTFIPNRQACIYKTYTFDVSSKVYNGSDNIMAEIEKIKMDNAEIFSGDIRGKIRVIFNTPENVDPTFKENLKTILFNDKVISSLIKETSSELISEVKEDIDDEYDFVLDNSLGITEKIHQFINKQYDDPMTLEELKSYINDPLKIS